MKRTATAIALAGFATCVIAQDFSLFFVGPSEVMENSSFQVDVYGDASVGTHILGGSFGINSALNNFEVLGMTWTPADWSAFNTDGGYAGDGNYNSVVFGQLVIPGIFPPAAGSELGARIGTLDIQTGNFGSFWSIEMSFVAGDPFTLETVDEVSGETFQSSNGNLTLGTFSAKFIPAPGSLAMLAMGGVCATRRRR